MTAARDDLRHLHAGVGKQLAEDIVGGDDEGRTTSSGGSARVSVALSPRRRVGLTAVVAAPDETTHDGNRGLASTQALWSRHSVDGAASSWRPATTMRAPTP
jgi:hypothetical protein